jgi:hypothetical protein
MPSRQATAAATDMRHLILALAILVSFGAIGVVGVYSLVASAHAEPTSDGGGG